MISLPHRLEPVADLKVGTFAYRITDTRHGSDHYGDCEVCGKHCATTYLQTEMQCYEIVDGRPSFTGHRCNTLFGHKECLLARQRGSAETPDAIAA